MGSVLAILSLMFNPLRHLKEATKVGSHIDKSGAQGGQPGFRTGGCISTQALCNDVGVSCQPLDAPWHGEKVEERRADSSVFFLLLSLFGLFLLLCSVSLF